MNRNNFWIHFGIAVVLIGFAAIIGQVVRLDTMFRQPTTVSEPPKLTPKPVAVKRSNNEREPEVLVKFRPDVSLAEIKKVVMKNNCNAKMYPKIISIHILNSFQSLAIKL